MSAERDMRTAGIISKTHSEWTGAYRCFQLRTVFLKRCRHKQEIVDIIQIG
jgi:hypothetical protein